MRTAENIILKVLGIAATILYGYSFLWISLMYLYGRLYFPLRELGLRNSIYFEIFVGCISLIIISLVFFKLRGRTFLGLLLQDLILIIILLPFFALVLGEFGNSFDDPSNFPTVYIAMFLMTILTINLNDWIKTKSQPPTAAL
jgi:hypothetical protein